MQLIQVPFEPTLWPMNPSRPVKTTPSNIEEIHRPVMLDEVLAILQPHSGGLYVDATLGLGGHTAALLQASGPEGRVLGLDQDRQALSLASCRLTVFGHRFQLAHANFSELREIAVQRHLSGCDGVLMDLGVSSLQLGTGERGFSFQQEGPLDMRMDQERSLTAHEVVNYYSEKDLANLIYQFGEEPLSRRIAHAIFRARPIKNTRVLAELVAKAVPFRKQARIHPATKTFQALRIFVNDELGNLSKGLRAAVDLLKPGGRLVVISFHSLEDRIVKETLRSLSRDCCCSRDVPFCQCGNRRQLHLLTKSPVQASPLEVGENPRARSAKLRAAEKL
jgi:16S rRNA (cytosine1402-N4)-methyltransferase